MSTYVDKISRIDFEPVTFFLQIGCWPAQSSCCFPFLAAIMNFSYQKFLFKMADHPAIHVRINPDLDPNNYFAQIKQIKITG